LLYNQLNKSILHTEVQEFIQGHQHLDPAEIAIKKSPFTEVSSRELAEQISGKKTAEKKLPLWYQTPGIYYPPKLALEQSSSSETAAFKSTLIHGESVLDLTGGLGIDAFYFSKKAGRVCHVELQAELSQIASHNAQVLGAKNIAFIHADGIEYLRNKRTNWDTIYLDPSRRIAGQKVFKLSECEPNVPVLQDLLFQHSSCIILKTAPLLDIKSALTELKQVKDVYVLSVQNEVKELLWVLRPQKTLTEPLIHCVRLSNKVAQTFKFNLSTEKQLELNEYSDVLSFLYEPDSAWLKAGCFKLITQEYQVNKLNQHTHFYTSEELKSDFPGRVFKVDEVRTYKDFTRSKVEEKANIISRNFPLSAPELQKKHRIKDGGEQYLVFCRNHHEELIVIKARRC
jgi:16S rRNA G966 N2-methylase RsmD